MPPTRDLDNLGIQSVPFVSPRPDTDDAPQRATLLQAVQESSAELKKQRDAAADRPLYEVAYAVAEGQPRNVCIQKRGEPDRPGEEVARRNLQILGGQPVPPGSGSGRLQLAQWLTEPSNPLTARVIVNRVWQHHFGAGLVRSASDFGTRGDRPMHPELLDYLTGEFVRQCWSLKSLHRMILASRAYQLASSEEPHDLEADPENKWLWRHSRQRLRGRSDTRLDAGGERAARPHHASCASVPASRRGGTSRSIIPSRRTTIRSIAACI